jgi:hypothetical protein
MKFSIRDLLLVTVIVALVVGWWVERNRLAEATLKLEGYEEFLVNLEPGDYVIVPEGRPHDGKIHFTRWPNSQASAPNPPKP